VPTVRSSTRAGLADELRAVADVGHLLRFRAGTVRRRTLFSWAVATLAMVTAAMAIVPAYLPGAGNSGRASEFSVLIPTAFAGFVALAVVSAVASGGGRELLPREQAVAYPLSPTTDHIGALLMAPLNIAWLLQAWGLLGAAAYAFGAGRLATSIPVIVLWIAAGTAIAQGVAWAMESVRRGARGLLVVRGLVVVVVVCGLVLHLSGRLTGLLDRLPTVWFVASSSNGLSWHFALAIAVEIALLVAAVVLGTLPAHAASRRTPRDEARLESEARQPLPSPRSDLLALIRTDRSSVWRAVPMRRGMLVLAIGPGLVAIAGDLPWPTMTVLPGLVASGGALLFGVNIWCLDGRGGLWRESLPVSPRAVFAARAWVLGEFLFLAAAITIGLASLRAGMPAPAELTALVCTWVVVTVQVVAAAMRWSQQRPYAVDLRSARATPAPAVLMVVYSARLAVSTTLTGLVFSALARVPDFQVSLLVAVPFLAWSLARLLRTHHHWTNPVVRSRIVTTVAA
jgi:hypothetical protein